MFIITFILSS